MKIQVLKNSTYSEPKDLPQAKSDRASGFDLIATSDPVIIGNQYNELVNGNVYYNSIDYIEYKTNLKISIQQYKKFDILSNKIKNYDVLILPRSSISKYNLVLANSVGLIDPDYRGEILVRFKYCFMPSDLDAVSGVGIVGKINYSKIYKKGDAICQMKISRVHDVEFELVDELDKTKRGEGGFGSTSI